MTSVMCVSVLLRNSNARGALIVKGGRVWCVRGCLRVAAVGDEKVNFPTLWECPFLCVQEGINVF